MSEAVITPTGEHRRIVSVTAGLFVLKTGSVDSLIAKATKFLLVISRLLALCNMRQVGWVEQDGPAVAADEFQGKLKCGLLILVFHLRIDFHWYCYVKSCSTICCSLDMVWALSLFVETIGNLVRMYLRPALPKVQQYQQYMQNCEAETHHKRSLSAAGTKREGWLSLARLFIPHRSQRRSACD